MCATRQDISCSLPQLPWAWIFGRQSFFFFPSSLNMCDLLQLAHWKKRSLASLHSVAFLAWPGWSASLGSFLLFLPPWKTEKKISIWKWLCSSRPRTRGELWEVIRDFLTSSGRHRVTLERPWRTVPWHPDPRQVSAVERTLTYFMLSFHPLPAEVWRNNVSPVAIK